MIAKWSEIQFSDADVVNPDGYDSDVKGMGEGRRSGDYVPWLIHDAGIVVAIVFASCEQDAIDEAVDADKLDRWQVDPKDAGDLSDYFTKDKPDSAGTDGPDYTAPDGTGYWCEWKRVTLLGNAGEPFDIETLGIVQLPNPPFSFVALFNAIPKE